ncbi:MAG: nickel-type superoxide dismutase maturation protease [Acidimicrobiales bacterium]|nr:nickel-type superoxide dismutase maturation protease [Acidimicrobiales bacterium]
MTTIIIVVFLARYFKRAKVEGNSMYPTFKAGDTVLVSKSKSFKVGDLVVTSHPHHGNQLILKRILDIEGNLVELRGDNPLESSDSRQFGKVDISSVKYKVIMPSRYFN